MILVRRPLLQQAALFFNLNVLNRGGRKIPIAVQSALVNFSGSERCCCFDREQRNISTILSSYRSLTSTHNYRHRGTISTLRGISSIMTIGTTSRAKRTLSSTSLSSNSVKSINVPRDGVLMIISPAKTFDLSPISNVIESDYLIYTQPNGCNVEQTIAIARAMKRMSKSELAKTLKLSPTLTDLTKDYWSNFQIDVMNDLTTRQSIYSKPSIFMYSGAAYQGISALECDVHTILYMQDNLRILDALYGVLRPLDQIQPYRLEMNTKGIVLPNTNSPITKLSTYWSEAITNRLIQDVQQQSSTNNTDDDDALPILLNLASDEYSAAIDTEQIMQHCRYIKVVFCEDYKVVAVHAKRARGLMARYVAEMNASTLEEIQQFNIEGYQYIPEKSDPKNTLVFNRSVNVKQQTKQSAIGNMKASASSSADANHVITITAKNKRAKQR